jgi:hypothetical protein
VRWYYVKIIVVDLAEGESDDHTKGDKRRRQVMHIDFFDCLHLCLRLFTLKYLA